MAFKKVKRVSGRMRKGCFIRFASSGNKTVSCYISRAMELCGKRVEIEVDDLQSRIRLRASEDGNMVGEKSGMIGCTSNLLEICGSERIYMSWFDGWYYGDFGGENKK